jgi:hypothetical protein
MSPERRAFFSSDRTHSSSLRDRRCAKLERGQKRWLVAPQLRISITTKIEVIEIFRARQFFRLADALSKFLPRNNLLYRLE